MALSTALENLILQLLVPNNEILNQGFSSMREAFKDPNINVALCECMNSSQNPQVRQYAAVLLRKKVYKAKQWKQMSPEMKQGLKQAVLQLFLKETDNDVRKSVTELIAAIAKHETIQSNWPEFMELLNQCISSSNAKEKELGLYAMSIVTASAGANFKPHLRSILPMFSKCLADTSCIGIPFHTIECLTHLVCCIGTDEMNLFQNLIPAVLQVIRNLITTDEDKACKAMEIFEELLECEVAVIIPHIKMLISFCLEVASAQNLQPAIRVKALSIIRWIIELKKKTILKHKLIVPLLNILIPIMCQPSSVGPDSLPTDDDEVDENENKQCPVYCAGQVIDVMALHLPPEKLIPPLTHHIETTLRSEDPLHRKAAYLALAVIAEGCSEYIRNKGLKNYVEVICKGMREESPMVRNPAFYCLEQFAEYLQPDINKFAGEILPLLLQHFDEICRISAQKDKDSPSLKYTFYALETFCESLGDDLLPYLPTVMERLLNFLQACVSTGAKEMAISAIGSVAHAATKSFEPYFLPVIEHLKTYINEKNKCTSLQIQAIDTLSILARSVSPTTFMPMAHDCINLGMQLVDEVDDPDLRRCIFMLFASVSIVLKDEMSKYLPSIIDHLLNSIQSSEGINLHYAEEENPSFKLFEESEDDVDEKIDDDDEEEDAADEDIAGVSVENAYMEEKEAACCALKDLAEHTGAAFIPYANKCFEEVAKVLDSPDSDVRREAVTCTGHFCIALNQAYCTTNSLEYRLALDQKISTLLPKVFALAREDIERRVVLACLETIQEMSEKIKGNFINGTALEFVVLLIKDVFRKKLACQDDDEEDDELSDQEAEYDMMLFQYAGNIIPSLFKAVPSEQVIPHFAGLLPFLLPKSKRTCTVSDKSFSIGTIAESVAFMEPGFARPYLNHLLPTFVKGMLDEDDEVRSNSVFGLGALVQNVTTSLYDQYPVLLQSLSNMLSKEDSARAKDNLCSALAKMIMVNSAVVPIKEVFPAFLQCLPLKEDMEENTAVYNCLSHLYSLRCEEFYQNLPEILRILSTVLATQEVDKDTATTIINLIQNVAAEFPNEFEAVVKTLPKENGDALTKALIFL